MAAAAGGADSGPSTLDGSADWQVGEGSGEFNWSYPIDMPTGQANEAPQLALTYSSAVADGMTGPSTAQASQVGLGWSLEPGHISRTYAACADDDQSDTSGDLCWRTEGGKLVDDLSLVLNGHATRLIRDQSGPNGRGPLRLQDDPGWRVETWGGPGNDSWIEGDGTPPPQNADADNEAFKLTSPDGTRYYFGYGTDSVWTVPVRGNNTGEPCNRPNVSVADAACVQAWQWNLDRVVDADGNRVKYTYNTETNFYRYNASQVAPYVRSGYLTSIQYGFARPTPTPPPGTDIEPQAAVRFEMAGRCNASIGDDGPNEGNVSCADKPADTFRDTPMNLRCNSGDGANCTNTTPVFFSTKRYKRILTLRGNLTTPTNDPDQPVSGPVTDRYVLRHSMVDPDDDKPMGQRADDPDLWLNQIVHQPTPSGSGEPPTAKDLPSVNFDGDFYDNLVVSQGGGKELQKLRLTKVRNELGGRVLVEYGHQNLCKAGEAPLTGEAFATTKDCYAPRRPGGTDGNLTWYHKYLVMSLTLGDQALSLETLADNKPSLGTVRQYKYTYRGKPGWRYDGSSKNVPAKFRSWSDWRGYQTTLIRTMAVNKQSNPGKPTTTAKSVRRVVVYRGMYNSRKNNGPDMRLTKADDAFVGTVERGLESTNLPDRNALRGQVAEETILEAPTTTVCTPPNCPKARWITRTYHGYKIWRTAYSNVNLAAYFTGESLTRKHDRVTRDSGSRLNWDRRHTVNRTFDPGGSEHRSLSLGTINFVMDRGASTSDNRGGDRNHCTSTGWIGNGDKWLRVLGENRIYDQTPTADCYDAAARLLSRTVNFYEDTETRTGANLDRGRLTKVNTYTTDSDFITTKTGYDKYGRVVSTIDGNNNITNTSYNSPEQNQTETVDDLPVKVVTNTNQSQTVTRLEKRRGLPTSVVDNGNVNTTADDAKTTTEYDGYGRVISVRSPKLQGAGGAASVTYEYTVNDSATAPARVKTSSRRTTGVSDVSYDYMDGWGRTIETQTIQTDGSGRLVNATGYDELGQPYLSMPVIANAKAPGNGLLNADESNVVRHELNNYDAAGRITRMKHMSIGDVEKYSTVIRQQGDRTVTTARTANDTAILGTNVEYFDGWNRTSQVEQYTNSGVDIGSNREMSAIYDYDGTNKLVKITSYLQGGTSNWIYTYDLAGRRIATDDPDTGANAAKSTSTYDGNGNQLTTNNSKDGTVKTVFDNQDRPVKRFKVLSGNPSDCADTGAQADCERIAKWTYDTATNGDGRLAASTSYTQLGTYVSAVTGYDLNGNALAETYTYPDNIAGSTPSGSITLSNSYTYNDADMVTSANYGPIGNLTATTVTTSYLTSGGQVQSMSATQAGQPNVNLLTAAYDKVGQPLRALSEVTDAAKHLNREYAWDNATGRLSRVGGSAFGTLDYTYDLVGNPTSATAHNLYSNAPPDYVTAAWCYTYDPLYRLKTARTGSSAATSCTTQAADTSLVGAQQNLRYNYSADRLVSVASTNNGTATQSEYNYVGASKPHQIASISGGTASDPALPPNATLTYDTAGRVETYAPSGGPTTTSTYNPTGTLKTSTQSGTGGIANSYAYDTDGMRVARRDTVTGTGGYVNSVRYLGNSELTVRTNGGATVSNGRRVFTTPGGKPLAIQAGNGTPAAPTAPIWTLQLGDAQDSLRFTRNQTAGTDSRPTYRPFGQAISVSSNGERGFLNKPQDPNGDVRLDQRNYQPQLNLLTTPDAIFNSADAQTLNPYSYSRNNPIQGSDPSGLLCVSVDGLDCGSGAAEAPAITKDEVNESYYDFYDATLPPDVADDVIQGDANLNNDAVAQSLFRRIALDAYQRGLDGNTCSDSALCGFLIQHQETIVLAATGAGSVGKLGVAFAAARRGAADAVPAVLAGAVRSTPGLLPRRNVGALTLRAGSLRLSETAVSGTRPIAGTVPEVGSAGNLQRFIPTASGANTRLYDSEYKLLTYAANRLGGPSNVRGVLRLYSERPPCSSCSSVLQQFSSEFPNIVVRVTTG